MKYLFLTLGLFLFFSCEDVVEIDLPPNTPQLVVEGNLNCGDDSTDCGDQFVRLTRSTDFFAENQSVPVEDASVFLFDATTANEIQMNHIGSGQYAANNLDLSSEGEFELRIDFEGDRYVARERYFTTPAIDSITNSRTEGFDDEAIEVNLYWKDDGATTDFYTVRFFSPKTNEVEADTDEFRNGNSIVSFVEISNTFDEELEEFEVGDEVRAELLSNSQRYHNFLSLLIEQSESQGPFPVTPAPLVGNIINTTRPEVKALGYFRLGQRRVGFHTITE